MCHRPLRKAGVIPHTVLDETFLFCNWSQGNPGGVSPMALTLSGTALAAGKWSCVSTQRTGGSRRAAHGVNYKVSAMGLTPPGSP